MGTIRPFGEDDIPQIIDLNTKLFPGSAGLSRADQEFRFREIALRNPWHDPRITSLVHVEQSGKISGFIGIIPRTMTFKGAPVTVGIGQHLMVDKSTFAALQLFKAFISGPQDISIADLAADVTKKLWERLGGTTAYAHSIFWRKPLRPFATAFQYVSRKKSRAILGSALAPLHFGLDSLLNRKSIPPLHIPKPDLRDEELTPDAMLHELPRYSAGRGLIPAYTKESLNWLFDILSRESRFGTLRKVLVKNEDGTSIGWYIYHMNQEGRSEVLQVAGTIGSYGDVLSHLFYDAWKHGSPEIAGRVDPLFMKEFSERYCLFFPGSAWMLIHSKMPEVVNAVNSGNVFLTRLDGDLWFF